MPPKLVTFTQGKNSTDLTIHFGTEEFELLLDAGDGEICITVSSSETYDTPEEMLGFDKYNKCVVCQEKYNPYFGLLMTDVHRWGVPAPNVWVCECCYQWALKLKRECE